MILKIISGVLTASNETTPKVATDLGTPETNGKRQIEKCSSEGTQADIS